MLAHRTKLLNLASRAFLLVPSPPSISHASCSSSVGPTNPEATDDLISRVSALMKKPNWEQSSLLKSLVSHMSPGTASKLIERHSSDIELGVRFFKWVCRQSTYCYDLDSRILLLKLMLSSNLLRISHKAIVVLMKECSTSEAEILKLMGGLDDMRKTGFCLTYPCYSTLLMSLARLGMGLLAFCVYKRMVADGFVPGVIDYRTIINALCKNGWVQAAETFFCRMLKLGFGLDSHTCTSLVLGSCRVNDLQEAFRVFEIMSKGDGFEPNSVTYSILIHGLCQMGKLEEAFCLKEKMSKKGCQPGTRTYTVLLKALCDFGLTNKALSLFNDMVRKGCKPNVHTYTILIDGLCREGRTEEANGLFREMLKDELFPGTVTYNALINGYCKDGHIISAFELLSVMERRRCRPNIRTYNQLMEGLCRVGKSYKAMFLLKRVIENSLMPDIVTFNVLIDGFCREGQLEMAYNIFKLMNSFGLQPDVFSFTAYIDGLCKQGRPEQASSMLGLMTKKGISPDEVTLTALIDGYCKIGDIGTASVLFERMVKKRNLTTPHTLNSFLDILTRDNKVHKGEAILGKMLKYGLSLSVVTYTILVNALCQAGQITSALEMLELMKRASCLPNVYTYTVVINGLCQSGRLEEAEKLLFNMPSIGISPNHITYTVLVKAHVNAGNLDRAFEILNIMVSNGCQPSTRIYSALLSGFVQSHMAITPSFNCSVESSSSLSPNENSTLANVFTKMDVELAFKIEDKFNRYGGSTIDLHNTLAAGLCKVGRIAEAAYLTKDVMKRGLFPEKAVDSIIQHYCKEHHYDCCLGFMQLLFDHGFVPSASCCCSAVHGLRSIGRVKEAQRLVSELLRHNDIEENIEVLPFIDFLARKEQPDQCLEILKLVEQVHYRERPII